MSFYERYATQCRKKNIPPASKYAAEQIGCSTANISAMSKRNITPKGEIIACACKFLNVSADYLLEIIDYPRPLYNEDDNGMNETITDILDYTKNLNEEGQEIVLALVKGIAIQDIYKKGYKNQTVDKKKAK